MASFENTTDSDIATELTNSLDRNGRGGMLAPFKIFDGTVSAPGIGFTQDPDNGFYRIGPDHWAATVGGVKQMEFQPGRVDFNGAHVAIGGSTGVIATGSTPPLEVGTSGAANAAYMMFNRDNAFIANFGIDTDNKLKIGGQSMGAVSYQLLHEDNSFSLATAGTLTTPQNILCNGTLIVVGRITGTNDAMFYQAAAPLNGVLYLGNTAANYLFNDSIRFQLRTLPLVIDGNVGVAIGVGVSPIATLDVKVAANKHIICNSMAAGASIGVIADDGASWTTLIVGGGGTTVAPGYDNATTLGYASPYRWSVVYAVNGAIQTSDGRQKKNIAPSTLGLAFIEDLNPVSYQWINEKNIVTRVPDFEEEIPEHYDIDGNLVPATTRTVYKDQVTPTPGTTTHYGLIAQDVKNAVTAAGATFGGLAEIPNASGTDVEFGLAYSEFIAPLVKAVQELSAKVKVLEGVGVKP